MVGASLGAYVGFAMVTSLIMATTFQLAHCVEEASFASADELRGERRIWAVHEVETTVDFCPRNPVLTWMLGGLNFQIEHHLFPRVPHTHYPKIARDRAPQLREARRPLLVAAVARRARCARTSSISARWAGSACRPRSRWDSDPGRPRRRLKLRSPPARLAATPSSATLRAKTTCD